MTFDKDEPIHSKAITEFACGKLCTIRIPKACNHDPDTSCWCHGDKLTGAGGTALKGSDEGGAIGCSGCHDVTDGRTKPEEYGLTRLQVLAYFNDGHRRSLRMLFRAGILTLNEKAG